MKREVEMGDDAWDALKMTASLELDEARDDARRYKNTPDEDAYGDWLKAVQEMYDALAKADGSDTVTF